MPFNTTPPKFCKDAIPTVRGWRHPKTGELLVSVRLSQEIIEKYTPKSTEASETQKVEEIVQDSVKVEETVTVVEEIVQDSVKVEETSVEEVKENKPKRGKKNG